MNPLVLLNITFQIKGSSSRADSASYQPGEVLIPFQSHQQGSIPLCLLANQPAAPCSSLKISPASTVLSYLLPFCEAPHFLPPDSTSAAVTAAGSLFNPSGGVGSQLLADLHHLCMITWQSRSSCSLSPLKGLCSLSTVSCGAVPWCQAERCILRCTGCPGQQKCFLI